MISVFQYSSEPFGPTALAHQIVSIDREATNELAMAFLDDLSGLRFKSQSEAEEPQICVMKDTYLLVSTSRGLQWADATSVSIFDSRWLVLLSGKF